MNAPSKDIATMLEADSSLGLFHTIVGNQVRNLFVGMEVSTPKNIVTVFDTPGFPDQLTMGKEKYEYPSIQIRVRNISYEDAYIIAENIKDSLHGRAHETCNGSYYSVIKCSSGPALLDRDDSGNYRFIINFNLQRR